MNFKNILPRVTLCIQDLFNLLNSMVMNKSKSHFRKTLVVKHLQVSDLICFAVSGCVFRSEIIGFVELCAF